MNWGTPMSGDKAHDQLSDEEAERRARHAIKQSFAMPHKPHKAIVADTPAARAQARRRAKDSPKSK